VKINGLQGNLLVYKERKNRTFRFPWSKKTMDGLFCDFIIDIKTAHQQLILLNNLLIPSGRDVSGFQPVAA